MQPRDWRPIVCDTTEVKLVWTLIPRRIAPAVFAHVPASTWGAMAGRSPYEAIFLQDTALGMNEMIVSSLVVQGAFPRGLHLLTEVGDAMGLPFVPFMAWYIQTGLYAVITATGCNGSSDSTQIIHQCDQNFYDSQMYISAVNFPLVFMFSVRRQMSPVSARRVAFVFHDFLIGFI